MTALDKLTKELTTLNILQAWLTKHAPNITEGNSFESGGEPYFCVSCSDYSRTKVLQEWAEAFGMNDWTAEPDGTKIKWTRTFDGVKLIIYGAKELPVPEPRPVAVTEWPLQLTEGTSVCH
jgi:hypothetical protein